MRLNKYLSLCGVASRRKSDDFIKNGRVKINGEIIKELGVKINPDKDEVIVNNRKCYLSSHTYLALNKPRGCICTRAVFKGEKSIYDILPDKYHNLKIAGRLDKSSEGLVILSDDGDFIYQLTHPKFEHRKEYIVELDKFLTREEKERLKKGVKLEEGIARFDKLEKIGKNKYQIIIHQGWKRQIRRMFKEINHHISHLTRIREGNFSLEKIASGKYKEIDKREVL